jgi:hypothetical protein
LYLLFDRKKLDETVLASFIEEKGYNGPVWDEFLATASEIANSI